MESFRNLLTRRTLVILFASGLFVRITFVLVNERPPVSDENEYDRLAMSLVTEGTYADAGNPTAYRSAGYPLFLAASYKVFGHHIMIPKLAQAVLDTITALLLFFVGSARSFRTGVVAASFWLFFIPAILYANLLLTESLSVFLIAGALYLFQKWLDRRSNQYLFACGIVLGLSILVKPLLLLFPFLLFLLSPAITVPRRLSVLVPAAALLVVIPWMTRNFLVLETFTLSTNGGMNLYIGNNPESTGAYRGTFPDELADTSLSETGRDALARTMALDYITAHPGAFLLGSAVKIAHVFRTEGDVLIGSFVNHGEAGSEGFLRQYRSVPLAAVVLTNSSYFLLMLFGMAGLLIAERDQRFWFTLLFAASVLIVHAVFFGGSRFHILLMPFAALYAADGAVSYAEHRLVLSGLRKWFFIACSFALASLWTYELITLYSI